MTREEFAIIFSKNLKNKLEETNLSQADIARRLKVSTAIVSNWCNAKKVPEIENIDKLCDVFMCTREYLMYEHKCPAAPDAADNTRYPNRYDTLVEIASELNDKGLIALEGNARLLASMPEYKEKGERLA